MPFSTKSARTYVDEIIHRRWAASASYGAKANWRSRPGTSASRTILCALTAAKYRYGQTLYGKRDVLTVEEIFTSSHPWRRDLEKKFRSNNFGTNLPLIRCASNPPNRGIICISRRFCPIWKIRVIPQLSESSRNRCFDNSGGHLPRCENRQRFPMIFAKAFRRSPVVRENFKKINCSLKRLKKAASTNKAF